MPLQEVVGLLAPGDAQLDTHHVAYVRAVVNARLGRWPDADADFIRSLRLAPEKTEFWHEYARRHAVLLAWTGESDRFRQLCEKTLADFQKAGSTRIQLTR